MKGAVRREVLRLLEEGRSADEVAGIVGLSRRTVFNYKSVEAAAGRHGGSRKLPAAPGDPQPSPGPPDVSTGQPAAPFGHVEAVEALRSEGRRAARRLEQVDPPLSPLDRARERKVLLEVERRLAAVDVRPAAENLDPNRLTDEELETFTRLWRKALVTP